MSKIVEESDEIVCTFQVSKELKKKVHQKAISEDKSLKQVFNELLLNYVQ